MRRKLPDSQQAGATVGSELLDFLLPLRRNFPHFTNLHPPPTPPHRLASAGCCSYDNRHSVDGGQRVKWWREKLAVESSFFQSARGKSYIASPRSALVQFSILLVFSRCTCSQPT
ncbi:uncharacterized protein RCC_02157 [Ramularia collo-cygni]|uniref:Uncharacterized protein n=1 Tax=Ramularia collo-cygni TaxID=112498 RepID=A0A2D3URU0_9PEZI|nr:uncharacterized protein RCC_02157 [Ramularia collo-cygni]CZT16315.1 uncharacterized protein RCC_02157 [Ramularia collo-cygni]